VAGKRVAYFTTARAPAHGRLAEELAELGAEVVHVSGSLSDRTALRRELDGVDAEVFLTEIKAAAIDVVAEAGARRGIEVVLVANEIVPVAGQPELEPALLALADQAQAEPVGT
jgi:cyclic 2,3-diphosphoglycerate synthetase